MEQMDAYSDFADRYDLFFGPFGEHDPAIVDFFRRLFAQHDVRSVLDCACGTGQDLHLFHSLGVEVVGSDVSEAMLAQARKNLAAAGVPVPLHRVDYRELPEHFTERFDAVACLSTSIAHTLDESNILRAFQSMRGVLRDGGILIVTQGTSDRQWAEKPRFMLAVSDHDFSRLFVIDYLGERSARYNVLDITHTADRQELRHWSTEYSSLPLRDDQERLLKAAGFMSVDFYGDYDFAPYSKESSRRISRGAHATNRSRSAVKSHSTDRSGMPSRTCRERPRTRPGGRCTVRAGSLPYKPAFQAGPLDKADLFCSDKCGLSSARSPGRGRNPLVLDRVARRLRSHRLWIMSRSSPNCTEGERR